MRTRLSSIVTVLAIAATSAGCGGGGNGGPGPNDDDPVLTALDVTPASATLFSVAPGNSVKLNVLAKDQNGAAMSGLGAPAFSSGSEAIATVGSDGTVTGVGAGTTQITASLTAGEVTKTATAAITVQAAPAGAGVTAPGLSFQPDVADVSAGGTVTWTFAGILHNVTFTTGGAPQNIPDLQNGAASRVFPNNGIFRYRCGIHPEMIGTVRVH